MAPREHDDDCELVIEGSAERNREWVEHAQWSDADGCTCYLKAVMARYAIYGDETLVAELPLDVGVDPGGER